MAESFEHIRTCHLCEAMCGLRLTVEDGRVTRIRSKQRSEVIVVQHLLDRRFGAGRRIARPN